MNLNLYKLTNLQSELEMVYPIESDIEILILGYANTLTVFSKVFMQLSPLTNGA